MSPEALVIGESAVDLDRQRVYDLTTQFAELIDGTMRTPFELKLVGNDLIGEDGRGLEEITATGLEKAKEIVKSNPNLWFELRRRSLEQEEKGELIEMAKGNGPNVKIVVSDFPAELMDATVDVGGYNVTRKQTMLRVLVRTENGSLQMFSQTLDRSNRTALEAIYKHFGQTAHEGELLGQRISVDVDEASQVTVVDDIVHVYDQSLEEQTGTKWYAGRRPIDRRNTYDFVCLQKDLIDECIRLDKHGWLNRDIMYNMAATMNKRFELSGVAETNSVTVASAVDLSILYQEIEHAGSEARSEGRTFSACGETLGLASKLEEAGYGNKTDNETRYTFNKKMHCVVCQSKAKNSEPKKMCGPCGICRTCDKKLGGKG